MTIYREGGGGTKHKTGGGGGSFSHAMKGGGGLAMLKGEGDNKFWSSFYTVV